MGKKDCGICGSADQAGVDLDLHARQLSHRKIAAKFGRHRSQIGRHARFCLKLRHGQVDPKTAAEARAALAKHEGDIDRALESARKFEEIANASGDARQILNAQRLVTRLLALRSKRLREPRGEPKVVGTPKKKRGDDFKIVVCYPKEMYEMSPLHYLPPTKQQLDEADLIIGVEFRSRVVVQNSDVFTHFQRKLRLGEPIDESLRVANAEDYENAVKSVAGEKERQAELELHGGKRPVIVRKSADSREIETIYVDQKA